MKHGNIFFICLATLMVVTSAEEEAATKTEKLISTFQIVRFPNDHCIATNTKNGTCYTSAECSDKGGTSAGSCADGFGVCCTFTLNACGTSASENITYFTNPTTVSSGICQASVCPVNSNIGQLRLEFISFTITGPSTLSVSVAMRRFGQPSYVDASTPAGITYSSNCQIDTFHVSGPSPSSNPPTICGVNTGWHMYVEADHMYCNKLTFNFADNAGTVTNQNGRGLGSLATRSWNIKVLQFEPTHELYAPAGCTQYFYGSLTGLVQSYNFDSTTSYHLAGQHDRFCIRREKSQCSACYAAADGVTFRISGVQVHTNNAGTFSSPGQCCGYQTQTCANTGDNMAICGVGVSNAIANIGMGAGGYDCVIIPGAFVIAAATPGAATAVVAPTAALLQTALGEAATTSVLLPSTPQICGKSKGLGVGSPAPLAAAASVPAGAAVNISICTRHSPFMLEFLSDDIEGITGAINTAEFSPGTDQNGFQISYAQFACS